MSDDLQQLQQRVEKGIRWLTDNDPDGAFHLWYTAGLTKFSPMPAQNEDTLARWRTYYDARELWEKLDNRVRKLEGALT